MIGSLANIWRLAQCDVNPTTDYSIGLSIPDATGVAALLALFSYVSPITMIEVPFLMLCTLHRTQNYKNIFVYKIFMITEVITRIYLRNLK